MKKWICSKAMCVAVLFACILVADNALGQTSTQMTGLEKKLYEAAKKEGKLLYWDSLSLKEAAQFIKAFNNRFPGIEVSYWEGNATQVDQKYFTEHQAGRNPVDVMQIELFDNYKKGGHLTDISDIVKDSGFPKECATKDFDAVAIEHTIRGVAYNSKLVSSKEVPRSWDDFLNPRWKGKIALETNMSVFITYTKTWGEENIIAYLKKLGQQNPIFNEGVTHTMTLLGAGEFPLGVNMLLSRTLYMQSQGQPVAWAPLSPIIDKFSPYVILRDAPHPNAAKLYMRWLMSAEGQSMVDKIRQKGNPMPGTGTSQSKALEQLGVKVLVVPLWEIDFDALQDRYRKAVGFSK